MSIPYPIKHCYFCNAELLVDEFENRDCPNSDKDCYYSVSCDDTNFQFTIDDIVFVIDYGTNQTTIIEWGKNLILYKQKYKYPEALVINKENYLNIVNRCRKLQAFK